jgi:MFS-type transporter involved in bile tolerance (Atg22 family)
MAVDFPMVRRYLVAVMFIESAMQAFSSVAAVYLVSQLGASGTEFALVILTLLLTGAVFSPVADRVSKWSASKYGDE